jgi:PAS domain S-box-containing protein
MIDGNRRGASSGREIDQYERLRDRSDLFRIVGESAADGLAVVSGYTIADCNSRLETIFERRREEIIGLSPWQLGGRPTAEREATELHARELMDRAYDGDVVRSTWQQPGDDGRQRTYEISLSRFDLGDGPRLLCWVREVTEDVEARLELLQRIDFQSSVVDLSNRLVRAPAEDLGTEIPEATRSVCSRHGIDRASIWVLDRRQQLAYGNFAAGFDDVVNGLTIRPFSETPWIIERLFAGATEAIRVPDDLPAEGEEDRRFFADQGFKSVLIIPQALREDVVGIASIGMTTRTRQWSREEITELQLLFQTIGSAWFRYLYNYGVARRDADLKRSQRVAGVGSFQIIRQNDGPLSWTNARLLQSEQADFIRDVPCCEEAFCALLDRVHPDDRDGVKERLLQLRQLDGATLEYRVVRDSGEVVHVEERFELDFDNTGAIDQIFGTIKDITVQVRSTDRLKQALQEVERLKDRLEVENYALREEVRAARGFERIIGNSEPLRSAMRAAERVAPTDITVLLQGETGTGKELFARSIHELSDRHKGPLISVNCAALSSDLIESELFGHERGAFTDAISSRRGRFELADGGTLFLDEVGELPLEVQAKLLRVLQIGEFERLGGTKTLKVDVRVIAATNRRLADMVEEGSFRDDLYYRINHFLIELPPLRDRPEDIPVLADHFVKRNAARLSKVIHSIAPEMLEDMMSRPWAGNVRELDAHIQRGIITSSGPVLDYRPENANAGLAGPANSGDEETDLSLEGMQRRHISEALDSCGWVIDGDGGAAAILGLPPSSLRSKMKRLGIERRPFHVVRGA